MRDALARIRVRRPSQMCRGDECRRVPLEFITASSSRAMNAGAGANGLIFVNRGIVEYGQAERGGRSAWVFGHEIGHQAANHIANNQRNATTGLLIGAVLPGRRRGAASYFSPAAAQVMRSAVNTGASVGGAVGRISFSKEQEREAD